MTKSRNIGRGHGQRNKKLWPEGPRYVAAPEQNTSHTYYRCPDCDGLIVAGTHPWLATYQGSMYTGRTRMWCRNALGEQVGGHVYSNGRRMPYIPQDGINRHTHLREFVETGTGSRARMMEYILGVGTGNHAILQEVTPTQYAGPLPSLQDPYDQEIVPME